MTRRALQFVALTFALSWALALAAWAAGLKWQGVTAAVVGVIYMWIPALAAIALQKGRYREPVKELGVSFRGNSSWYFAWLVPLLFAGLTLGVSLLVPGTSFSPTAEGYLAKLASQVPPEELARIREQMARVPVPLPVILLIQAVVGGTTINAVAAFGEELGWRGFLQKELGPKGFWRSSLLIGVIWGIWHAPLIAQGHNYPEHPLAGIGLMTVFTALLSPLLCQLRRSAGSVVAAAIFHGTLNGVAGLPIVLISGGSDLTTRVTGAAGLLVLLALDVGLFLSLRRQSQGPVDEPNRRSAAA